MAVLMFLVGLAALVKLNPFGVILCLFAVFIFGMSLVIAREAVRKRTQSSEVFYVASNVQSPLGDGISAPVVPPEVNSQSLADFTTLGGHGDIVVERRNQWVGRLGYMDIHVDGIRVAFVGAGETARLITESGRREVQVRAQAASSPPLNIELHPGEVVRLTCGFKGTGWRMLLGPYIALRRHSLYLTRVGDHPAAAES
ncbi:MAG: hypothetical protein AB7L91_08055 [Dehalococcoidia bacterium]